MLYTKLLHFIITNNEFMNDFFSTYCKGIEFYRNQILIFFKKIFPWKALKFSQENFPPKCYRSGKRDFQGKTIFPEIPFPKNFRENLLFPFPVIFPTQNKILDDTFFFINLE